jgi:hypothetical protein
VKIRLAPLATSSNVATGIPSVDAVSHQLGVTAIGRSLAEPANAVEAHRLGIERWYTMYVPKGIDIEDAVRRYAADPNIEQAQPDWLLYPAVVPTDPAYANHWGHHNTRQLHDVDWGGTNSHTLATTVGALGFDTNAERAWNGPAGFGSSTVIIAIIDSGCNLSHPDLTFVTGFDYGDNDSNPEDDCTDTRVCGHGTCCAGVAAANVNNANGACGAAPACKIMPLKAVTTPGTFTSTAIANCITYAVDNGASIISISLTAAGTTSIPTIDDAITYASGLTILAATGNENNSNVSYPANHAAVIAVGAASPCGDRKRSSTNPLELNPGVFPDANGYTCDGERWWGSNYGTNTADAAGAVDLLGPTILYTTDPVGTLGFTTGDYDEFFNGTSCATPYVAGVAALIKSKNPSFTPAQIRAQLIGTAIDIVNVEAPNPGWDRYSGYGMVDMAGAVGDECTAGVLTVNTAWDQSQNLVLPSDDPDPEWIVVADPYELTIEPRVATTVNADPSWLTLTNSKWLNSMENYVGPVNGHFVYQYKFCLTSTVASITMQMRADDQATVSLNGYTLGSTVASSFNQPPLSIATTFFDYPKFNIGANVLQVDVNNTNAGSVGFNVSGSIGGQATTHVCCAANTCTISGNLFHDYDQSKHRNKAKEPSIPLWVVFLYRDADPIQGCTSDGFGNYCFTDLAPGVYRVEPISEGFYKLTDPSELNRRCVDRGHDIAHLDFGYYWDSSNKSNDETKQPHTVSPEVSPRIDRVMLAQNVPNPFNPETHIRFAVPQDTEITLAVYDVEGRLVKMLVDGRQRGGEWLSVTWDGRSDRGSQVASGVYFYRLTASGTTMTKKMILLK